MRNDTRTDYVTRDSILKLLFDDEIDEAGHRRRLAEALARTEADLDADTAKLRGTPTKLDPDVKNAIGCGANASRSAERQQ